MAVKRFKFAESEFFRNVSFQMIGTGLAQLLPFAVTPILTRMYTEADFAVFTTFFSIAGILVVGAGARYQYAIVLPKEDSEAIQIFNLSVCITIIYSILLLVGVALFHTMISHAMGNGVYFIPLYILLFGLWTSFSILSVRAKSFFQNAVAKVIQSFSYILSAIGLGIMQFTFFGLIIGKILGVFFSWIYLMKKSSVGFHFGDPISLKRVAYKYQDYPKYGLIPAFMDVASVQGLVLILARFYSINDLGYFGLTNLVLSAPLGLIGGSFKDVFYQKIASLINDKEFETALSFFKKSVAGLFLIGLPVCLIIFFFGADIFKLVFGNKWGRSGDFAAILSASFLIQLVVSPLSTVFNAANKVRIASIWQVLYFFSTFVTLGICASLLELQVEELLIVYVVHEVVLYSIYLFLQYWTLKKLL